MAKKSVCFGCDRRCAGCAAACPEYKAERAERQKEYDARLEQQKLQSAQIEMMQAKQKRNKKKHG